MKRFYGVVGAGTAASLLAVLAAGCSGSTIGLGGKNVESQDGGSGGGSGSQEDAGAGGSDDGSGGSDDGSGGTSAGGANSGGSGDENTFPGGRPYPDGPDLPPFAGISKSKKLDVLLVVDNSISMGDKQAVLRQTVPDLVARLTSAALGVDDLHVGVVTSSLGGHGSSTCEANAEPLKTEQGNDHAYLVGSRPRAAAAGVTSDFASWTRGQPSTPFVSQVGAAVQAAGEHGCGFEATLESAYRFLADPAPPASIVTQPCSLGSSAPCAVPSATDETLLAQRAAFLRPDSAVAVVVLSDENDCSIRDSQQYYFAARTDIEIKTGASVCRTNPNDPCCYSCLTDPPPNCAADPICQDPNERTDTKINLRCFDQKRRFGLDFLYPTARYVNAFSKPWLCTTRPDLGVDSEGCPDDAVVKNPLFQSDATARGPSMVYVLSITGVPRAEVSAAGKVAFDKVLGDPAASPPVPPTDALMIESVAPRGGNGVNGEPLAPPASTLNANSSNGHEWDNTGLDDLQYSCIFALPEGKDCAAFDAYDPLKPGCDCLSTTDPNQDHNPLCQDASGGYSQLQTHAKAYPGLRHIEVAKGLGRRGIVGSICTDNLTDQAKPDYGYRVTVNALVQAVGSSVE